MNLMGILACMRKTPRPLIVDENLYLQNLAMELRSAESDAERWRIFEREGFTRVDGFDFDDDVIARLMELRRSAVH